jgi:hypothetical protein
LRPVWRFSDILPSSFLLFFFQALAFLRMPALFALWVLLASLRGLVHALFGFAA